MLVDAFLYAGEGDMAELRRDTLTGHVDRMVAVSCTLTHQGDPAHLEPPPPGIAWAVVEGERNPDGTANFYVEGEHRRAVPRSIERYSFYVEGELRRSVPSAVGGWPDGTVLLVSDVDEIPDPATLPEVTARARQTPVAVPMRMHGFALDYRYPGPWRGTTACLLDGTDVQVLRERKSDLPAAGSGWHLSWLGDSEYRHRKLATFLHTELAGLDVDACWREGTHANGERLVRLTREEVAALDWPAPLFDGFDIPASWWAP